MSHINQNPKEFIEALRKGLSIACGADGSWLVEGQLMQLARRCFGMEESRIISIAHALGKELDFLEKVPIMFKKYQEQDIQREYDFKSILEASQIVIEMLKGIASAQAMEWNHRLERKLIALQYRLESVNGGLNPTGIQEDLLVELKHSAIAWKKEQAILIDKNLTPQELQKFAETATYPEFAKLILADIKLREAYFEWVLRDKNAVAPFIQYPLMQSKIVDSALNGRIGRLGGTGLKIVKAPIDLNMSEKVLTLSIEGKPVSLLNENAIVTFKGNYKLSINEIFEVFKNKIYRVGNLEFLAEGIVNWNVHHLGYWDADKKMHQKINLELPSWWEQLPIFEVLSRKNAARRYGMVLDGIHWVVAARATRGSPTLNYDETHAFMEIAIPRRDGSYAIYDFGKFAYQYPSSFFNSLLTFCLNMHATVAYPDENVFYSQRQHGCYPFLLTSDKGLKLMDLMKEDMIKSREYNFIFQIESENCAKWLYEKLTIIFGDKVPNLFKMSLLQTEPVGFVGACFNLFRKLKIPHCIQFKIVTLFHIPFGAGKVTRIMENGKMVMKALNNHDFWTTSEVYLPAFLIEQIESGSLEKFNSMQKPAPLCNSFVDNFKPTMKLARFFDCQRVNLNQLIKPNEELLRTFNLNRLKL